MKVVIVNVPIILKCTSVRPVGDWVLTRYCQRSAGCPPRSSVILFYMHSRFTPTHLALHYLQRCKWGGSILCCCVLSPSCRGRNQQHGPSNRHWAFTLLSSFATFAVFSLLITTIGKLMQLSLTHSHTHKTVVFSPWVVIFIPFS